MHRRASGGYVIRYRHHPELGTIDLEDPLSLPLAKLTSNGDVAVGMALARHREYSDAGPKEVYLVIFEDGPGQVATRKDIVEMNAMFAKTPGLIPLVVEVVGL